MHRFGAWRSLASALEWGSRGRRFESCRPDFFPRQALWRERQRAFSIQGFDLSRPADGFKQTVFGFAVSRNSTFLNAMGAITFVWCDPKVTPTITNLVNSGRTPKQDFRTRHIEREFLSHQMQDRNLGPTFLLDNAHFQLVDRLAQVYHPTTL